LVLELEHVRMRGHVAGPLEEGQGDGRRGHLVGEVFTYEAGDLGLVFQAVDAGDDAAGAVAKEEHRQARLARFDDVNEPRQVRRPLPELLHEEALAFGAATAPMNPARRPPGRWT